MSSGINVYASLGTLNALSIKGHRAFIVEAKKQFQIGGFTILPFELQHDAAEPLGFLIYHKEFGRLLFATDTFYIKYKFPELNYIAIECNYSGEILNNNIREEKTNTFLKRRLLSSHFSLENVKKFFLANDLSKLKEIKLLHLSDGNSNAKQFKSEIEKLTGVPVSVC
jgi:phosphoribosyl 1,2-cyclic phosphodiesterase